MSDLSLPPDYTPAVPAVTLQEIKIVKLAREIAMELRELDEILEMHCISKIDFERLKVNPHFVKVLSSEIASWQSAINTHERVKLKAGSMIEEWLPELYARLNDPKEDLMKKVKGGELVAKLAGLGTSDPKAFDPADRVTITINLGEDKKLEFNKRLPPQVIEHEHTFEESVDFSLQANIPESTPS